MSRNVSLFGLTFALLAASIPAVQSHLYGDTPPDEKLIVVEQIGNGTLAPAPGSEPLMITMAEMERKFIYHYEWDAPVDIESAAGAGHVLEKWVVDGVDIDSGPPATLSVAGNYNHTVQAWFKRKDSLPGICIMEPVADCTGIGGSCVPSYTIKVTDQALGAPVPDHDYDGDVDEDDRTGITSCMNGAGNVPKHADRPDPMYGPGGTDQIRRYCRQHDYDQDGDVDDYDLEIFDACWNGAGQPPKATTGFSCLGESASEGTSFRRFGYKLVKDGVPLSSVFLTDIQNPAYIHLSSTGAGNYVVRCGVDDYDGNGLSGPSFDDFDEAQLREAAIQIPWQYNLKINVIEEVPGASNAFFNVSPAGASCDTSDPAVYNCYHAAGSSVMLQVNLDDPPYRLAWLEYVFGVNEYEAPAGGSDDGTYANGSVIVMRGDYEFDAEVAGG